MKTNDRMIRLINTLRILYCLQVGAILALIGNEAFFYLGITNSRLISQPALVLPILFIFVIYNSLFVFRYNKLVGQWKGKLLMQQESWENINQMNLRLRSQRHDFLNHIQIIYGMTELAEYDELRKYLEKLYSDINAMSLKVKTSHPAIDALLQAKNGQTNRQGINFFVAIQSKLNNLKMPDWEVCRCLGNLIDNAITAVLSYTGDKNIWVRISETVTMYIFEVENTGMPIDEDIRNTMFEPGISTKKEEGHGMGLYIVKELAEAFEGEIEVRCKDNMVLFQIKIPKIA